MKKRKKERFEKIKSEEESQRRKDERERKQKEAETKLNVKLSVCIILFFLSVIGFFVGVNNRNSGLDISFVIISFVIIIVVGIGSIIAFFIYLLNEP